MATAALSPIEELCNCAIAAGCLQAVMSLVHPELTKFVDFQRARVARADSERASANARGRHRSRFNGSASASGVEDAIGDDPERQADLSTQLKYLRDHWRSHLRFFGGDAQLPVIVQRALVYRNKVSHQSAMTLEQYEHAIATFEKLAELIECNVLIRRQMRAVVTKLMSFTTRPAEIHSINSLEVLEGSERYDDNGMQPEREPEDRFGVTTSADDAQDHTAEEEDRPTWEDWRSTGNAHFLAKEFDLAIEAYSKGIELTQEEPVLFGNRATCYLRRNEFELARDDAEEAMELDSDNVKYYRLLSEAHMGLEEYEVAREVCEEGLVLDDKDKVLLSRIKTAISKINKNLKEQEKEKERQAEEERRQAAQAFKEAEEAAQRESAVPTAKHLEPSPAGATLRSRKVNDMGIAEPINYNDIPVSDIDAHPRDSPRFKLYQSGVEFIMQAATLLVEAMTVRESGGGIKATREVVEKMLLSLKSSGEAGVAEGWYRMAVFYSGASIGIQLVQDIDMQIDKLHKAAGCKPFVQTPSGRVCRQNGVGEAENELGVIFRDGNASIARNADRSFTYFLRSAQHDFPVGQLNVAKAYMKGEGTAKDLEAARFWASRAAQHQLAAGQLLLARMFEEGIGGPKNASQARAWLQASRKNEKLAIPVDSSLTEGMQFAASSNVTDFENGSLPYYVEYVGSQMGFLDWDDTEAGLPFSVLCSRIFRPVTPVITAEINSRADSGGLTARNYLAAESLIKEAHSLLESGDADAGLSALRRADALWERPRAAFDQNFLAAVLIVARRQYEKNSKNLDAAYALGRWDMDKAEDQVRHWKKCIKTCPAEASFHFFLGVACWDLGKSEEAHDAFSEAYSLRKDVRWLYWLGNSKISLLGLEAALPIYKEYIATNPPDERFVPDALYSLGSFYVVQHDFQTAMTYFGLAENAEGSSIRFPALLPKIAEIGPKEALTTAMHELGFMESSMISDIMTNTVLPCEFCQDKVKPSQLLAHKLLKCPRRRVVCTECEKEMTFDDYAAHEQAVHQKSGKASNSVIDDGKHADKDIPTPAQVRTSQLPSPKFHFFGTVKDIVAQKGSKPPLFKVSSESEDKWELRVTASAAASVADAAVGDTIVIFWRNSPSVEAIDKRSLRVPESGSSEHYGRDVVIHIVKISVQTVAFEFNQLRHVRYDEHDAVCSYCSGKAGTRLSGCSSCKRVKYCSRDCQKVHWKRIHRFMCKNIELLDQCMTESINVAPNRYPSKDIKDDDYFIATGLPTPENTLDILRDILHTFDKEGMKSTDTEHIMLPPYGGGLIKPESILGSVRFYRDKRTQVMWAQFRVGYLTSTPTQRQQQELVNFFHLPPHNPLELKYQDKKVHLERCKVMMDDADGKGFRLGMDVTLNKLPLPALAELLDYLIANTTLYLS